MPRQVSRLQTLASSGNFAPARLARVQKEPTPRKSTDNDGLNGSWERKPVSRETANPGPACPWGTYRKDAGAHVPAHGSIGDLAGVRSKVSKPLTIFYGYPPELIARWCGVTQHTAYLYKIGARKPSRQALRLFTLHRDGRVLGPEWREWAVHKDKLISPEGKETTHGQLNAYWLVMQLARELASKDPDVYEDFNRILRSA